MAQCRAAAARGGADRVPDRAAYPAARPHRCDRAVRNRADRSGGTRARRADAGLHVPAGRATDDRWALAAVVRVPGDPRRAADARRLRRHESQPGRRRRRQRLALRDRPRAARRAARLQRTDRAHARRDVADRRLRGGGVPRGASGDEREPLRRGRRDLRQRRVRPAQHRRRAVPRQRADAAEAQPVRARRDPRRRAHAARPRHRRTGEPADAVGPDRQPALRVRRGRRRRRAGDPRDRARGQVRGDVDDRPRASRAQTPRERRDGDGRGRAAHAGAGLPVGLQQIAAGEPPDLDPREAIATRTVTGGAAPAPMDAMLTECRARVADVRELVGARRSEIEAAEGELLRLARG